MRKGQLYFFFGFLLLIGFLAFLIAMPYLSAIVLAAALAVACSRPYHWLAARVRFRPIAALLIILSLAIVIFLPFWFVGSQVLREATSLYDHLGTHGLSDLQHNAWMAQLTNRLPPGTLATPQEMIKNVLNWIIASAGAVAGGTIVLFLDAMICVFALYYFLKDGAKLRNWVLAFSPLPDRYDEMIMDRLSSTVNSLIGGYLILAILQGVLAGIAFSIFGIPNATLWGCLAALMSLIPAIGTTLVFVPAIAYLFLKGHAPAAVALWAWWLVTIGVVENIIGPRLVNRGARIHPFAVFIAVLGGISFFGPVGFFIGPLVFSLFFTLIDIYVSFHDEGARPPRATFVGTEPAVERSARRRPSTRRKG